MRAGKVRHSVQGLPMYASEDAARTPTVKTSCIGSNVCLCGGQQMILGQIRAPDHTRSCHFCGEECDRLITFSHPPGPWVAPESESTLLRGHPTASGIPSRQGRRKLQSTTRKASACAQRCRPRCTCSSCGVHLSIVQRRHMCGTMISCSYKGTS